MLNRVLQFFLGDRQRGPIAPNEQAFEHLLTRFPALQGLSSEQRRALYQGSAVLLNEKTFQGADGFEPEMEDCLAVALLATLPILVRGPHWYSEFHTFILYPDTFVAEIEEIDDQGLVHSGRDLRSGEAWLRGPVVLAMNDVWASGQGTGFNVVIHELAHQIDHRNGEANGFPPLVDGMDRSAWTAVFTAGYEKLLAELDQGLEPSLDPYAAEAPAEYFAVASEFFFDAPEQLISHSPEVYNQLGLLYGYATRAHDL